MDPGARPAAEELLKRFEALMAEGDAPRVSGWVSKTPLVSSNPLIVISGITAAKDPFVTSDFSSSS